MTAVVVHGIERPPLTCTVKTEDGEKEIKMSYGLFNDLQRVTPDAAAILDTITSDPYTRDYIIRRAMTPLKKMVKDADTELVPAEDIGLDDPDEINKLLQWVTGHLLYFFATSVGGLKQLSEAFKVKLGPIDLPSAPSPSGSQN